MPKKPIVHKYKPKKRPAGALIRKRMREGYLPDVLEIGTRRGYRRYRKKTAQSVVSALEPIMWPLVSASAGALAGSIVDKERAGQYAIAGGMGGIGAGLARFITDRISKNPAITRAVGPAGFSLGLLLSPFVLKALGEEPVPGIPAWE